MIDFNTHTFLSNGRCSPGELVRRAEEKDYRAIGITDHVDASNIELVLSALLRFCRETQPFLKVRIIPGVEITHVPPGQIAVIANRARQLGARLIILHGETITEPVAIGTNRAGLEAKVDIIAHPGLISEEDMQLAADTGVSLEISSHPTHSMANGRIVSLARKFNVPLVLNSDAHRPEELLTPQWREKVAFGAGLTPEELEKINSNMMALFEKIVPSTFLT
ncbi:MAG: PHP domain-containing protein [Spirochaetes bacterium]|nr:MAG: PHP domain-containing protein [Spirochaetota bacterium]